ncbi:hypothetical protein [Nocardia brasiliensis]|nr:hypothetical protein [Nocardia brasiliensis]
MLSTARVFAADPTMVAAIDFGAIGSGYAWVIVDIDAGDGE